jgi:hypothetical protein
MELVILADLVPCILIVGGICGLTTRRTVRQATGTVTVVGLAGLLYLLLSTVVTGAFPGILGPARPQGGRP